MTSLDLAHLPPDDPVVYRMLQEADTIGVFQVESRAQMATLPRLKPRNFYDLVVEVAIIRPGPIVGQMVHPFIARRNGREPVEYPHPSLEPILKRTLGVPLFQEQLLRMAMVVAGFTGGEAEELRRAMGFKRSEARMRQIETKLRDGMARNGITGEAAEAIVRSITSFALYGFPESHAASFALLVYASAYLKAHFPAAFYAALLNNQPMGFYHPATIVKDAQRRGVGFRPIDVQASDWLCTIEPDGAIRLGLSYVNGLREEVGRAIAVSGAGHRPPSTGLDNDGLAARGTGFGQARHQASGTSVFRCSKCGADDPSMLEITAERDGTHGFCNVCAHEWGEEGGRGTGSWGPGKGRLGAEGQRGRGAQGPRFRSVEHLIAATGIRRDELATLAEIGALNAFGYDRRSALWQIERAVRPAGELFAEELGLGSGDWGLGEDSLQASGSGLREGRQEPRTTSSRQAPAFAPGASAGKSGTLTSHQAPGTKHQAPEIVSSPLRPMTLVERVVADYAGTGLTIGPHPMALRRQELALRGILRAIDLPKGRAGRRVRVAGAVITRQRPGTAKGMVFLTLEDETGVSNIIVRPDVFAEQRQAIVHAPYVIVEGVLQQQDGVTAVRAERVDRLTSRREEPAVESHDFY